jgi:excisionase family DNA binding protein
VAVTARADVLGEALPVETPGAPVARGAELAPLLERVYLLPGEVGTLLRVSPKTVYRLASQDPTMPALKIGGSLRFPRERLLAWLRAREQGAGRSRRLRAVGEAEGR